MDTALFLRPSGKGALIIDGVIAAEKQIARIVAEASSLRGKGIVPGLAVVLVGHDAASEVYVRSKGKAALTCGFHSIQHNLPETVSEQVLVDLVETLNQDPAIHGILVQLPLPSHIQSSRVLEAISPQKDVDGFHPVNVGLLSSGGMARALVPCTPLGAMELIQGTAKALGKPLSGMDAIVIGRSNIVGKPMAQLLLGADCTVTIAHSRSLDLVDLTRRADLVIAAVGRPEMIKGDWIKPGAIVIDVGINRISVTDPSSGNGTRTRLVGDVDYEACLPHAAAITPVPGGVGRMTIAMLMANTLTAAKRLCK